MSLWLRLLLSVICLFCAVRLGTFAYEKRSWKISAYSISLFFLGMHQIAVSLIITADSHNITLQAANQISEWSSITAVAFILFGLVHLIRDSKPGVARFPIAFTGIPFLIIVTYPFAHDAEVINQWLMKIYEGGGVGVAIVMYGYLTFVKKQSRYLKIFIGALLLLFTYVVYWFLSSWDIVQPWLWLMSMTAGIILIYTGYFRLLNRT